MKKFSLSELKLANELCFPADFERLAKKYLDIEGWFTDAYDFRKKHKSNLIEWFSKWSRHDLKQTVYGRDYSLEDAICKIIDELIGNIKD